MNHLARWWFKIGYLGIAGGRKKIPKDAAVRIAFITNMGISFIIIGPLIKGLLRWFGLGNIYFLLLGSLASITVMYLLLFKMGIKAEYVRQFKPEKDGERNYSKEMLAAFTLILYGPACFLLMIVIMKYL